MAPRVSTILWGANYENVLSLGYPLFSVVTDREPRDGSEWVQGVSAVEDAWLTGFDYTLECEARWLPVTPSAFGSQAPNPVQTQASGPTGVQGFLDWARAKNAFRFVPDYTLPLFYVDNCYLVEPRGGRGITAELNFSQQMKFRNPSMDFLQALRGIMFEYAPGGDIAASTGIGMAFSSAVSRFLDNGGLVQSAAANVLRERHYDAGRRVALFEEARTNLILSSEDLRTNGEGNPVTGWGAVNTTLGVNATAAPDGAVTADKVIETVANAVHSRSQTITITAGRVVVIAGFFKAAERTQGRLALTAGGDSAAFDFDTAGSGSITSSLGGTAVAKLLRIVAVPGLPGWWYVWGSAIVNAASTSILCEWALRKAGTASYTGTLTEGAYYWGCQAEQLSVLGGSQQWAPAFYIPTTTTTVTRTTDLATWAWPWRKQRLWIYAEFLEHGLAYGGGVGGLQPTIAALGAFGVSLRTMLNGISSGAYGFNHGNSVTTRSSGITLTPAQGDRIALLGLTYDDDSCQIVGSKNGAADVVGTQSAAGVATPLTYSPASLGIGTEGSTPSGLLPLQYLKIGAGPIAVSTAAARTA